MSIAVRDRLRGKIGPGQVKRYRPGETVASTKAFPRHDLRLRHRRQGTTPASADSRRHAPRAGSSAPTTAASARRRSCPRPRSRASGGTRMRRWRWRWPIRRTRRRRIRERQLLWDREEEELLPQEDEQMHL
ncbi:hypothetical protein GUJ93_ZPchr0006g40798 [Zizania palustris]|uniref:Uncharacterized protein n=1 Tax=Zizania palustris TaxID=103762 RepID=A0A8J5VL54_ZIZPA|nr:hypothetical protein GUJ93_ZPchr0006g40798 [Zizania palustris]